MKEAMGSHQFSSGFGLRTNNLSPGHPKLVGFDQAAIAKLLDTQAKNFFGVSYNGIINIS